MIVKSAVRVSGVLYEGIPYDKRWTPGLTFSGLTEYYSHGGVILLHQLKERLPEEAWKDFTPGFLNHKDEFLTREEAYREALSCGQVKSREIEQLFSEDLWFKEATKVVSVAAIADRLAKLPADDLIRFLQGPISPRKGGLAR